MLFVRTIHTLFSGVSDSTFSLSVLSLSLYVRSIECVRVAMELELDFKNSFFSSIPSLHSIAKSETDWSVISRYDD